MKMRFRREEDGWTTDGRKITASDTLDIIHSCLENDGPIIIEHWFYRGSCGPDRMMFEDFEAFMTYLHTHASAGDAVHVWNFAAVCKDYNTLASGKCPDEDGLIPTHGAY